MTFHPSLEQIHQVTTTGTFLFAVTLLANGYPALLRYAEKTRQFINRLRRDSEKRREPREIDPRAARAIAEELFKLLDPAIGAEKFPAGPNCRPLPRRQRAKNGKRARRTARTSPRRRVQRRSARRSALVSRKAASSRRTPKTAHVRDKIRQQLQVLRDLGLLEFLGSGLSRAQPRGY